MINNKNLNPVIYNSDSDNYSKTYRSLWQYCKDIPAVNDNGAIVNFNGANATDSFNCKAKSNWSGWG